MKTPEEGILLRIFIGEDDHYKGKPLYEAIVTKARELHLAGATVLRGVMGFGAASRIHTVPALSWLTRWRTMRSLIMQTGPVAKLRGITGEGCCVKDDKKDTAKRHEGKR